MSGVWNQLVLRPLRKLYDYGPEWGGLGFWGGRAPAQVCAEMTKYSELFWLDNMADCHTLINNKFYSFQVVLETAAYFFVLATFTRLVFQVVAFYFFQKQVVYVVQHQHPALRLAKPR